MSIVFGGEKAWKVRRLGDIGIAYHWVNQEPAMVLYPASQTSGRAFIVCLSAAYKYVLSDGNPDMHYMMGQAMQAADFMGFGATDKAVVKTIIDAITDGLPDLVSMPPEPYDHQKVNQTPNIGEMSLSIDGETIAQADVPDVPEHVTSRMLH